MCFSIIIKLTEIQDPSIKYLKKCLACLLERTVLSDTAWKLVERKNENTENTDVEDLDNSFFFFSAK